MKPLSFFAIAFLTAANAHAELKLSPAEIAAKKLLVCHNLQSSIEQVSQLANHHSIAGDAEDSTFFVRMQGDLTNQFKQIQCESRLEQEARDRSRIVAACKKVSVDFQSVSDQILDLEVAALGHLAGERKNEKRTEQLYIRQEALRKQYANLVCTRYIKTKKAAE